jgi:formamidopyrimidine-DNA glycosylase
MPELPELEVMRERLTEALVGRCVTAAKLHDPFVLRSVEPPFAELEGATFTGVHRRAKRIVLDTDRDVHVAVHLMLGGRLHLKAAEGFKPHRKRTLLSVAVDDGTLLEMTEAGTKRRASVLLFRGELPAQLDRGVDPLDEALTAAEFARRLRARNRQLKGALRHPDVVAGIGNAYADEILHAARLSPLKLTGKLTDEEIERLHATLRDLLLDWIDRVRDACPEGLPTNQNLWRKHMAVHGRPGEPCPACGEPVQRISFKDSETHYCPACQNDGRLLADRRMSRFGVRRPERK